MIVLEEARPGRVGKKLRRMWEGHREVERAAVHIDTGLVSSLVISEGCFQLREAVDELYRSLDRAKLALRSS